MVALLTSSGSATASPPATLPLDGGDAFLGVAQCSSSQCHGSVAGPNSGPVRFNEYRVWQREDPHATRAYEVLKTARSKQIVERLGWTKPATKEPRCLSCHSTVVADARHGKSFDPDLERENGITCEVCHGGSSRWIRTHTAKGTPHQANLEAGMFPTDEADQRAELCLSCHLGDNKSARFVTHRMMAAGHPRTTFELATFTLTQPAHFVVDEDYRQRGKAVSSAAKTWVIGQLVAARLWLSLVGSSGSAHDGSWPEFTLYDCDSCHQLISPAGVSEVSTTAGDLGFPRPAWDSLLTAQLILATVGARGAGELKQVIAEIERLRPSRDLAAAAAPATRGTRVIDEVLARMNDDSKSQPHDQLMDEASLHKMLAALAERSTGGLSYAVATQRYMAAQSLVATIEKTDRLQVHHPTETGDRSLSGALAPLYGAVQNSTTYTPDRFRAALAHLIASTPQ